MKPIYIQGIYASFRKFTYTVLFETNLVGKRDSNVKTVKSFYCAHYLEFVRKRKHA